MDLAVLTALKGIADLVQAKLNYLSKQLELANPTERSSLIKQKLKHEKRLNFILDKLLGLMGYVDEDEKTDILTK